MGAGLTRGERGRVGSKGEVQRVVHNRRGFGPSEKTGQVLMFKVRWERRALNELTELWTRADPFWRQAITIASHQIDQRLRNNGPDEGESRSGDRRIAFALPLAVVF